MILLLFLFIYYVFRETKQNPKMGWIPFCCVFLASKHKIIFQYKHVNFSCRPILFTCCKPEYNEIILVDAITENYCTKELKLNNY